MTHRQKFAILVSLIFSVHAFGQASRGFEITGEIQNAEGKKIFVAPRAEAVAIDSAIVKNGKFRLSGKVKETDYYALLIEGQRAYLPFILSNDKLTFKGDADSIRLAHISGSKELHAAQKLRNIIKPFFASQSASFDSAFAAYNRGDSVAGKRFEDLNVRISNRINDSIARFIQTNPSAYTSLARLNELQKSFGTERTKKLFMLLSPILKNHTVGKQLKYQIFEAEQLTSLNRKAINFQQTDTANKLVRLTDYKGKYVLIDFWASWCMPCRAENPTIKKAYAKFNPKGFEVLGVSLDNNKEAWIRALIKDELPWQNVSDLNGFKNVVAQKYAVTELPTNYLLDPKGKIIAKNLKGESLMEKLQALFGG